MSLCGTTLDHCCWLGKAGKCPHVQESVRPGFLWDCGLRVKLGSWGAVHASSEYKRDVQPMWDGHSIKNGACGDFPLAGMICTDCGEIG